MVNTFCLDPDFRKSAELLNNQRLGKQRTEANQILTAIRHLRYVAKIFNLPEFPTDIDTPREKRDGWSKIVFDTFKRNVSGILIRNGQPILIPSGQPLPQRIELDRYLYRDANNSEIVHQCKQLGPRSKIPPDAYDYSKSDKPIPLKIEKSGHWSAFVLPGEELITLGFSRHTAVTMWIGFETALMDYINVHIDEWVRRGFNNNMKHYNVPPNYARPAWSFDPKIINNFQCTLVERELDRKEPFWYSYHPEMVQKFTSNSRNFQQFWELISRYQRSMGISPELEKLSPGLAKSIKSSNLSTSQEPLDPTIISNLHEILHRYGSFPGFIWP